MIRLILLLSMLAAQFLAAVDIDEKMANEKVIESSQAPILNQSRTESEIVIDEPYSDRGPIWADDDIVIDSAYDYQAISVATRRSTGEIFVAASYCEGAGENYKFCIWSSPDGINWSEYLTASSPSASFSNPSLNIFTTADSEYIVMAYEFLDTATNEYNLKCYRRPFGGTGYYWNISVNPGIDERDPDLCNSDLRFPNDPWLFCAFESGDSIAFVRSVDYGKTWTLRQIIGVGGPTWDYYDPDCAFGWLSSPDSMFIGVAWQYFSSTGAREIRFRQNTINGTPGYWRDIESFSTPANCFDDYPCLQMTHGTYPSAVIMFVREDTVGTDNANLYKITTDDGAQTWHTQSHYNSSSAGNVPNGLGIDDTLGYYHLVFRDQSGYVQYQKARYDSTYYGWPSYIYMSSGNGYSQGDFPAVGVRNHQPYVCWADWHSPVYKLKFDAEWLQTGIEERPDKISTTSSMSLAPNPSRGSFKIFYNVTKQGPVKIALYDISGRLVRNLVAETKSAGAYVIETSNLDLASGIYLIRLETADNTTAKPITVVR